MLLISSTMELIKQLEPFNSFEQVRDHLLTFNITCKVDPNNDNIYLITYDRKKSNFTLPFMRQCRGTILEKGTNKILCYTFDKGLDFEFSDYDLTDKELFLNGVSWEGSRVEESVDGTQIRLFYYDGKWNKATTRCTDAYRAYWYSDYSFGKLFDEAATACGLDYDKLDTDCCYSFVLCHPDNRIVVEYSVPTLVHVVTRNLETFEEVTESYGVEGVRRPNVYNKFDNPWQLVNYAQIQNDFTLEGYMVHHLATHTRMKIISNAYLSVKELRGNGNDTFFRYLELRQNELLTTFLQYFPEFKDEFKAFETNILNIAREIKSQYINKFVFKAIKSVDWQYRPIVYKLHGQYLKDHQKTTLDVVLKSIGELHPKQLCFMYNRTYYPERYLRDEQTGEAVEDTLAEFEVLDVGEIVDGSNVVDVPDTLDIIENKDSEILVA